MCIHVLYYSCMSNWYTIKKEILDIYSVLVFLDIFSLLNIFVNLLVLCIKYCDTSLNTNNNYYNVVLLFKVYKYTYLNFCLCMSKTSLFFIYIHR